MSKVAKWPIITGVAMGILAPVLVFFGNPGNMGICAACFIRDTVGALGFHRASAVQYIRPEIIGIVLGAFLAALFSKEFKPRAGSSPIIKFFLGLFGMFGALIFLGCPWRALLRLSGGDWNAIAGIVGFVGGVLIGMYFLKRGFSLGKNNDAPKVTGYIMPIFAIALLAFLLTGVAFIKPVDGNSVSPIFFSLKGPGSMHAPILIALAAGVIIGILAQRSRFCTISAVRDTVASKNTYFLQGVIALIITAFVTNMILGQFHAGFENQPIAHTDTLWNILGMILSGLAFTLAGSCPGRLFVLSSEGDSDATVFLLGMAAGAAIAHNFNIASSTSGITNIAPYAVGIGLLFCLILGFTMRQKTL